MSRSKVPSLRNPVVGAAPVVRASSRAAVPAVRPSAPRSPAPWERIASAGLGAALDTPEARAVAEALKGFFGATDAVHQALHGKPLPPLRRGR